MIEIKDVSSFYGGKMVLKDVNFWVDKGELFGVAGNNGAGKSTLLKVISRVKKPEKGKVLLNGVDIWDIGLREFSKHVAVVSQSPSYEFMRVEDFVALGRIPHFKGFQLFEKAEDRLAVAEAMELCEIDYLKDRSMDQISGGERQLVFIARALATRPKVLLLDEPLSNLDISNQEEVLSVLEKMKSEMGLTIVAVLHDLNVISEFCDRVLLLKKGRVLSIGKINEVINANVIKQTFDAKNISVFDNPVSLNPFVCVCKPNHYC